MSVSQKMSDSINEKLKNITVLKELLCAERIQITEATSEKRRLYLACSRPVHREYFTVETYTRIKEFETLEAAIEVLISKEPFEITH